MADKRILFVDDQQDSAKAINQITKNLQDDWEIKIVGNGNDALTAMQEQSFKVVVSEMVLPDMDVVQLLQKVSELYPGAARFVLSGNSDKGLMMKAMEYVHQFIAKPSDPNTFMMLVNNSIGLRNILSNSALHEKIASIKSLPSAPKIYNQLVTELQSPSASIQKIAELIKQDVSITVKLLQLINSAFFGLKTQVNNPTHAVNLLGLDTVRSLVLAVSAFNQFDDPKIPGYSIENIYNRSTSIGACSRTYATILGLPHSEDSLIAGMLHDIGKLVMLTNFKREFLESVKLAESQSIPLFQAEKDILGVSDAEIGSHLLSLWGLSDTILEAVALHYNPTDTMSPMINTLTTVHIAYAIDHDQRNNIRDEKESALDMDYLTKLNLKGQIPNLRNFAMATVS